MPAESPVPAVGTWRPGPAQAYLLLLCGCMSTLAVVLVAPILPDMQAHFAAVPGVEFLVPVSLTAPSLVVAALSLFVGAIADRVGRKRLLVGGLFVYSVFGTAPLWLDSLHAILASRLGVGLNEALIMTCCTALIGDYFHGVERERYLALNTTFASTSAVIFMAVGGALGELGWRAPYSVYTLSLLLAPAAIWLLREPSQRSGTAESAAQHGTAEVPWSTTRLAGICTVTLVGAVVFMAIQVHIGYLLGGVGVTSPRTIGMVAAAAQIAVVTGSLLFRLLLRVRAATAARLGIALCICGAGFLLAGLAATFTGVVAGALLNGLGAGILLPTLLCWNMCHLTQEHRALGTGAWMAAFFFGQFITPLVVVGISKWVDGLSQAIWLMGSVLLPCAMIVLLVAFGRNRWREVR
ncbi:MAG: MFS transporter [Gammaproteobacteria bacterium]|nr:MAG: MFS transporter [Gammaproteobacteria bacterium]